MKTISRFISVMFAVTLVTALANAEEKPWIIKVSDHGLARLEVGGDEIGQIIPCLFEKDWMMANLEAGNGDGKAADGARKGLITAPSSTEVATELRIAKTDKGLKLSYKLTPKGAMNLEGLFVRVNFPTDSLLGGKYVVDGKEAVFPKELGEVRLHANPIKSVKLMDAKGKSLQLDFAEPMHVVVQDDRQWSEHFLLQIGPLLNNTEAWPANKSFAIEFTLSAPKGITAEDE